MKSYAFVFLTIMFALMACTGGGRMEAELSHIDSLTEADQSAAIARIDSITAASGSGMARSVRMRLALLRAKACNKLLFPLNRDSLLMLDGYFTDHGTPNERMLAKYIIGCSYLDDNDAASALDNFHKAAALADTSAADCDYLTLLKIHAQTARLLYYKGALHDADEEYKQAFKYSLKAKDTLNAIISIEQKANIYKVEGKNDSVINIRKKVFDLYMKHGYTKQAATSLGPLIDVLSEEGRLDEAKRHIDNYEKNSGLFDSLGNIASGKEFYYCMKGEYYMVAGRLDSAEYFFRKCVTSTKRITSVLPAFARLSRLYKRLDRPDSVAKYAELAKQLQDSVYRLDVTRHLQQMQAVYNYDRHVEMAEKESAYFKALGTAVALILLLVIIYMVGYIIRKRKLRLREKHKLEQSIGELQNANHGLEAMDESQRKETRQIIDEKTKEIERLQREKAEYESKYNTERQPVLADNPAVRNARALAMNYKSMTAADCARLKETFSDYMPLSQWEGQLSDSEYLVCLLVRAGFSPADIGILTQQSPSNISNIRKRLYLKMTGKDGSPKDFDKYIKSL